MIRFLIILALFAAVGCKHSHSENQLPTVSKRSTTFHVATNGNDNWTGRLARANRTVSDGPFRTIARALKAASERDTAATPITIVVGDGTFWLEEPIVLTSAHSNLKIVAATGVAPVVSAGVPITGWKLIGMNGNVLWVADVPGAREEGWFFRQLWVNGERRVRARHPNTGYFKIAGVVDATPTWEHGHKRFLFSEGEVKNWPMVTEGEAVAMSRWVESRMPIVSLDERNRMLTSSKKSVFQLQAGNPFYVEHVLGVLDQPGEWYLDRTKGKLIYYPLPGERIEGFVAVAPRLSECLRIEGHPDKTNYVENIHFKGLTFANNEWYYGTNFGSKERHISSTPDPEIYGSAQAAFIVPGAVQAEGARHVVFENCSFRNIGSYALQLGRGCQSNTVSRCEFSDLAAGGIRLGETVLRDNVLEQAHDNIVVDCSVHDGGKMFHSGEGIWIGQSYGNQLRHNLIYDFFYTGISIGWTWGYEASLATNNLVEFNHVHHIGKKSNGDGPILGDMGIIYTLGMQPGTVIRNNLFHDIFGLYFGWGIYFDEGASFIRAENNVVYGTTHGAFHQHYGKENILRNNIFAFGRDQQLQRSRSEDHSSFSLERNIIYFDSGKLLEGDWDTGKYQMDHNLFFDVRTNSPGLNFIGGLDTWRKKGRDVHSIIADPLFVSTNLAEAAFAPDSPVAKIGFIPFNIRTVGPRAANKGRE